MRRLLAELRYPAANHIPVGSYWGASEEFFRFKTRIPAASAYRDPVLGFRPFRAAR